MTNESHSDTQNNKSDKAEQETVTPKNVIQTTNKHTSKKTRTNPMVAVLVVVALASSLYNLHLTHNLYSELILQIPFLLNSIHITTAKIQMPIL